MIFIRQLDFDDRSCIRPPGARAGSRKARRGERSWRRRPSSRYLLELEHGLGDPVGSLDPPQGQMRGEGARVHARNLQFRESRRSPLGGPEASARRRTRPKGRADSVRSERPPSARDEAGRAGDGSAICDRISLTLAVWPLSIGPRNLSVRCILWALAQRMSARVASRSRTKALSAVLISGSRSMAIKALTAAPTPYYRTFPGRGVSLFLTRSSALCEDWNLTWALSPKKWFRRTVTRRTSASAI